MRIGKVLLVGFAGLALTFGGGRYFHSKDQEAQAAEVVKATPQSDDEKTVMKIFEAIQKDIADKNYERLGTYGMNSMVSGGVKAAAEIKEHIDTALAGNLVTDVHYFVKGTPTQISQSDGKVILILTEPYCQTTANLEFSKIDGKWMVWDINGLHGYGREIKDDGKPAPPIIDTTALTNEQIIRKFYQALIDKDTATAAGLIELPDDVQRKKYKNLLLLQLRETPISEILGIQVNADSALVQLAGQPATQAVIAKPILNQGTSGKKITAKTIFWVNKESESRLGQ